MTFAICAVAKNENVYINDWVKYHIDLGFNRIFVYDNNDSTYEDVSTRIDPDYIDKVEFIPIHDQFCNQQTRYEDCYNRHGDEFDWIAFIDIDEFITLGKDYYSLEDFAHEPKIEGAEQVKLAWDTYGDNGIIEGDESVPIFERLKEPCKFYPKNWATPYPSKSFCRGHLKDVICRSSHSMYRGSSILPSKDPDGIWQKSKMWNSIINKNKIYIRHFRTKTLSEYLKYKMGRTDSATMNTCLTKLNYFFDINPRTPAHDRYLEKMGVIPKLPKIAICAVAKHENDYVNDWAKYHIDIGFDKIFFYDNNESTYENVKTRIDSDVLDRMEIIDIRDQPGKQADRYQEFYETKAKYFDWIIFLDLDEYITPSTKYYNLKEFLEKPEFKEVDEVEMCWSNFGDGGIIERDITVPVPQAGFKLSSIYKEVWVKSFIRSGKPLYYFTHTGKGANGYVPKCVLTDGTSTDTSMKKPTFCGDNWFVSHYRTRSISEYVRNKLNRTDCFFPNSRTNLEYFYYTNPKTSQHEEYLKKLGIIE